MPRQAPMKSLSRLAAIMRLRCALCRHAESNLFCVQRAAQIRLHRVPSSTQAISVALLLEGWSHLLPIGAVAWQTWLKSTMKGRTINRHTAALSGRADCGGLVAGAGRPHLVRGVHLLLCKPQPSLPSGNLLKLQGLLPMQSDTGYTGHHSMCSHTLHSVCHQNMLPIRLTSTSPVQARICTHADEV